MSNDETTRPDNPDSDFAPDFNAPSTAPAAAAQPAEPTPPTATHEPAHVGGGSSGTPPAGEDKFVHGLKQAGAATAQGLGKAYSFARDKIRAADVEPLFVVRWLERFVAWARDCFTTDRFNVVAGFGAHYGHLGLLLTAATALLFFLIASIQNRSPVLLLAAFAVAALLLILQYVAHKFLDAGDRLIKSSPSRLASPVFLDCLALLILVAAALIIIRYLASGSLSMALVGIGTGALGFAIAFIALNPELINVSVDEDTPAGEEAIGILSFLVKAVVRLTPIAFGIGSIVGCVALIIATFSLLFRNGTVDSGMGVLTFVVSCTCLPLASYIVFALFHLTIDVLRAVLAIPGKIDQLIRK